MPHRSCDCLFNVLTLLVINLPACFSVILTSTHRLNREYAKTFEEPYFQLFNFTSVTAILIRPPKGTEPSARFGEAVDAFRHKDVRYAIVGAPHQRNKTGAVYLCPYKRQNSHAFECEATELPIRQPNGSKSGGTSGMLLGSSVSAATTNGNQGFGLYCGHLYRATSTQVNDQGETSSDNEYKGLCNFLPLRNRERGPRPLTPCVAGGCLAGFSSRLATSSKNPGILLMAIGAPALEDGHGQVHVTRMSENSSTPSDGFHFSHMKDSSGFKSFYTGYATDFARKDGDRLLVSTPRDFEQSGSVAKVEVFGDLMRVGSRMMRQEEGSVTAKAGEGFGLSLASAHFTGSHSQRMDFLVGEPFYTDPETNEIDVGRVHVYCRRSEIHTVIVGAEPNGRFGSSVARISDINGDNLDEFAVSCPYCDNRNGAIFFFFGKKDCVYKDADQVIRARDLMNHYGDAPNLMGLGMSMTSNVDVDGNGLSDLLIGAPRSNVVVFARSRMPLSATSAVSGKCLVLTDMDKVRKCDLKFNFDLRPIKQTPSLEKFILKLRIRFLIDSEKKNLKRLRYDNQTDFFISRELESNAEGFSTTVVLRTKKFSAIRKYLKYDKTTPLKINCSIELMKETTLGDLRDRELYPFPRLVIKPGKWSATAAIGNAACGNKPCETDYMVDVSTDRYPYLMLEYGSPNATLIIHIMNTGPEFDGIDCGIRLHFHNGLSLLRVHSDSGENQPLCSSSSEKVEVCDLTNAMSNKEVLRLQVDMDALSMTRPSEWSKLTPSRSPSLRVEVFTSSFDRNLKNNADSFNFTVIYSPKVSLTPGTTSQQTVLDQRNKTHSVRRRERIHWQRIGPQIIQVYQLANTGQSAVYDIRLNITTPVASEFGERLLYLSNQMRTGGDVIPAGPRIVSDNGKLRGHCTIPLEFLNPLNLTIISDTDSSRRVRRSADPSHSPVMFSGSPTSNHDGKGQDRVACGEESKHFGIPRCAVIQCKLDRLVKNDVVRILMEGWLWSETTQKKHISDIEVVTSVQGQIFGIPPIAMTKNATTLLIRTVNQSTHVIFPNVSPPTKDQLPIWIIVVSIVTGILLLALIVLCLKKVGFFKRRRRPYATHGCHFEKYGSSGEIQDGLHEYSERMLNYHHESDREEKEIITNVETAAILPSQTAAKDISRQQNIAPSSIDTGISEEVQSSSSSPSQALEPRDGGYESPGHGISDASI